MSKKKTSEKHEKFRAIEEAAKTAQIMPEKFPIAEGAAGLNEAEQKAREKAEREEEKKAEAERAAAAREATALKKNGVLRTVFKVDQLVGDKPPSGYTSVNLSPVAQGNYENREFFHGVPNGSISFSVANSETRCFFEEGGKFNVDFSKVEDKE